MTGRRARRAAVVLAVGLLGGGVAAPGAAQSAVFSGYDLDVFGVGGRSPFGAGGLSDYERLRLMLTPAIGALRGEAAYEQLLLYQQRPGSAFAALAPGAAPVSGDWLDLDWTILRRGAVQWRQRFDRLNAALAGGPFELRIGRQAVSWATTLLLTPADPFAPFDPSDPFREYRGGVDAARLQVYPGAFSALDLVVRPSRAPRDRSLTAALRGKATLGGLDLSAWGGVVYGDPAAALGATGTVAGAAWRMEVSLREDSTRAAVLRTAVGLDRRWSVFGRDLYALVEYQRDGYGARDAAGLGAVLLSRPFQRGELQVLGRDVVAGRLEYQAHPLVAAELLVLWDAGDGSAIAGPAVTVSASNDLAVRAGAFLPAGRSGLGAFGAPASEFGVAPSFSYASVSLFF